MFNCMIIFYFSAIQMADEDGLKKHSEKLFKKVKVCTKTS